MAAAANYWGEARRASFRYDKSSRYCNLPTEFCLTTLPTTLLVDMHRLVQLQPTYNRWCRVRRLLGLCGTVGAVSTCLVAMTGATTDRLLLVGPNIDVTTRNDSSTAMVVELRRVVLPLARFCRVIGMVGVISA